MAALSAAPVTIDVVITDYNMPGMSGLDVAREVSLIRANLPVAVASGTITADLCANAANTGIRDLISKGLDVQALCAAIEQLVKQVSAGQTTVIARISRAPGRIATPRVYPLP